MYYYSNFGKLNFSMSSEFAFSAVFFVLILSILALDLGLFRGYNKYSNTSPSLKHSLYMSILVVCFALGFYFFLLHFGHFLHNISNLEQLELIVTKYRHAIEPNYNDLDAGIKLYNKNIALEYITGYVVEYALSVDNIFVILLIFTSFNLAKSNYHKVLIWGILGAIFMRFTFIFLGASLISKFGWILYVFGGFLLLTGIKMFFEQKEEKQIDTSNHIIVKLANKYFRVHDKFIGDKFFVVVEGIKKITPLFLVLLIVEFTDVIFAVDSIPAIFSITKDPYIVFFSNIFAVIGLRSMFFLLANVLHKFRYLKIGLATLLLFIGLKMLFHNKLDSWNFTTTHSLIIIVGILSFSILASLLYRRFKV